jgi:hypothetical protein
LLLECAQSDSTVTLAEGAEVGHGVFIKDCVGTTLVVSTKVKAVTAVNCTGCTLYVHGTLGIVEARPPRVDRSRGGVAR